MFQKIFSFEGRIRRSEFFVSRMIIGVIAAFTIIPCFLFLPVEIGWIIALFFYIMAVWAGIAQGAKRCHDRGNSGWWQLIPLYEFVMIFGDGQPYENEFGPDPKGRDGIRPPIPDVYNDILDSDRYK